MGWRELAGFLSSLVFLYFSSLPLSVNIENDKPQLRALTEVGCKP